MSGKELFGLWIPFIGALIFGCIAILTGIVWIGIMVVFLLGFQVGFILGGKYTHKGK